MQHNSPRTESERVAFLEQGLGRRPRMPRHAPVPVLDLPPSARIERNWDALLPRSWYARRGKALFEFALLLTFTPVALVPCVLIACCNWLVFRDPRQILFTQLRCGHHGRPFRIFKFRTMRASSTADFQSWSSGAEHLRVTRLGRFLRSTHLDELPQLLNIWRGEMALIGPRPEMVEVENWARRQLLGFDRRLALKPGITGFAQITQGYVGLDEAGYARKFEANEHYRLRLDWLLDLEILGRTLVWILRGRGWDWRAQGVANQQPASSSGPEPTLVLQPQAPAPSLERRAS